MKRANLAIFVPHAGCPCRCSFCSQTDISGADAIPNAAQVTAICAQSAAELPKDGKTEIAFFGGSFTAIDRGTMVTLLAAAFPFVQQGIYSGIRISTRPDAVEDEMLALLARYGVTAIELGAQSMDDAVLEQNRRGHAAAQVADAAKRVKAHGFELGLQMMTGLYGADEESDLATARQLLALKPDTVRVYPTVVLQNTYLAALVDAGKYLPQTLDQAVALGARLLELCEAAEVRVIRMGLHAQDSVEEKLVAGPYHPAFRELCEGRLLAARAEAAFAGHAAGKYRLVVAPSGVSKFTGHGGYAVAYLRGLGYNIRIKTDDRLSGLEFRIEDV